MSDQITDYLYRDHRFTCHPGEECEDGCEGSGWSPHRHDLLGFYYDVLDYLAHWIPA